MHPPSVTLAIYCFPRRLLIFSFRRRVIILVYHSKGLWEYIPKSIQSVCTTIFKRIAGLIFYPESFMLYVNGFVSPSSTNNWKTFSNLKFLPENRIVFKRIERREYWSNCNVLYINGFVSTSSTNLWKFFFSNLFFKFWQKTGNFDQKPKNIRKNSEAWILIKLLCVIYQWIRLNEHYKLMESFFSHSFRIFSRKPKFFKRIARREYWSNCNVLYGSVNGKCMQCVNGKLFSNFTFKIISRKPKNIQTAWIFVEVQCVIYQWIRLDKLFFNFRNPFSN